MPTRAAPTRFQPLDVDAALAAAKGQHLVVALAIGATWCPSCQQLERELYTTADGDFLFKRSVALYRDFDAAETQPLVRRFAIISLPTLVVLRADGSEVGRIEGYDDKRSFTADLSALLDGQDRLPECERRLNARRDDVVALFCVAKGYLDRGRSDEALPMLEEVLARDAENKAGRSDQALFVLGRWYARAQGDNTTARHFFRELDARYPTAEYGQGAAWWYAKTLLASGQPELGYTYLHARALRLATSDATAELGQYALKARVRCVEAMALVDAARAKDPKHTDLKEVRGELAKVVVVPAGTK